MNIHLGIDVDGIIADFNTGFMNLFVAITNEDKFGLPRPPITTWNYATDQFGYTKEQDKQVWRAVMNMPDFWSSLPAYKDSLEFLTTLSQMGVQATFITSRVGIDVLGQTQRWLVANGYPYPNVIISSNKGATCNRIGVTTYLDDKNENCVDTQSHGVRTYMLKHPYNQPQPGIPVLYNLGQFLDIVAGLIKAETTEVASVR